MGRRNSSKTRVQPVFESLLQRDPTGKRWLPQLLDLIETPSDSIVRASQGRMIKAGGGEFERRFPPAMPFLRWLIENPGELTWPVSKGKRKTYGQPTQRNRESLLGYRGVEEQMSAKQLAHKELIRKGAEGSRGQWWAFEGFTAVDFCISTEKLLLLVEGKRTDILAQSTEWYRGRNQLLRNLESGIKAAGDREFGVVLVEEQRNGPVLDGIDIARATPHLTPVERAELIEHYWGSTTWADLCKRTGVDYASLPNTLD